VSNPRFEAIGQRYLLHEQLGSGGMGVVYRATDRLTGQLVALKRVTQQPIEALVSTSASQNPQLLLANEFQTLASLRHPHIISVLDYGFGQDQQPYFTMELLNQVESIVHYSQRKPANEKIRLISQTLQALAYLHRRGIMHRDLKPDNAIVQPDGQVRLLDFGLASLQEKPNTEVAGTLTYIAPEVLRGDLFTPSADLYAVGVMLYELFSGQHPFQLTDPTQFISDLLLRPADLSILDVEHGLAILIGSLLAKTPAERPATAEEVLKRLASIPNVQVPQETVAIRESFLQAAKFVGRDRELALLEHALTEARQGRGSAWLVAGESGIGKSRLLDELRARALIHGCLVLRGQSVSDIGLPYRPWRDVVKRLILASELSDLEASILKEIVPDIEVLLQQTIPNAPELGQVAERQRLLHTIADLFRRQTTPTLLLLEDLHWADESLEPLRLLNRLVADLPLLIVGSYRDDERPTLPDDLPTMRVLKLPRLNDYGIRELSYSMLGESGRQTNVVDLLKRETEGNVYFLIEVVRTLAEEAGTLNQIGYMTLPGRVFANGIRSVVSRRLERLPAWGLPLLELMAITGRYIDLPILTYLANQQNPPVALDQWLTICNNSAILELHNERWQFAHDKLREVLLESILPIQKAAYHQQVADTIETIYRANEDLPTHYSNLAQHYGKAGNLVKERHYCRLAAERAVARFASIEANLLLNRALELTPEADLRDRFELFALRARLGDHLGQREMQHTDLLELERLANQLDSRTQAEAALQFANYHTNIGNYERGIQYAEQALKLAQSVNSTDLVAEGYLRWGQGLARQAHFIGAIDKLNQALELSAQTKTSLLKPPTLLTLGNVSLDLGDYAAAQHYYEESLAIGRELGDFHTANRALNNVGEVARYRGDYVRAGGYYEQAYQSFHELGNPRGQGVSLGNLGLVAVARGAYQQAADYYEQAQRIAEQTGDLYNLSWLWLGRGILLRQVGRYDDALAAFKQSLQLSVTTGQRDGESWCLSELALLHHYAQQPNEALQVSQQALKIARELSAPPLEVTALIALAHVYAAQRQFELAMQQYPKVIALQRQLTVHLPGVEANMGMAEIAVQQENWQEARRYVEAILVQSPTAMIDGLSSPFRAVLICGRVLSRNKDARANGLLQHARQRLATITANIKEPQWRQSFLALPLHQELQQG
jgi:tetratricopeptide (TPR) repeat protein